MKRILLTLIILIAFISLNAQEHLCFGIYYYKNPNHEIKHYNNILVVTNAPIEAINKMKKILKGLPYNMIFNNDIFPPIKDYTEQEIRKTYKEEAIDAVLYLKCTDVKGHQSGTFGVFNPKYNIYTSFNQYSQVVNLELSFIEIPFKENNEKVFYGSGNVDGKVNPAMYKTFHRLLEQLEDMGIALPNEKKKKR